MFWKSLSTTNFLLMLYFAQASFFGVHTLEEIVSKSTLLATRPSRLAPKKCINKSIWLATGGAPSMGTHHGYLPGANQIDLFMHFLGASRDGLVARRVDLDTISSSDKMLSKINLRSKNVVSCGEY
jgi:hypothetical protein